MEAAPASDHGADAVFLPTNDAAIGAIASVPKEIENPLPEAIRDFGGPMPVTVSVPYSSAYHSHPPPADSSCPLYLLHLTLLI